MHYMNSRIWFCKKWKYFRPSQKEICTV